MQPSPSPLKRNWEYRSDLEGVRGIAILMVILFHARVPFASGGFAGVDVFFVLSGFLISGILFEEVRMKNTISLVQFWARRARRLLPAATVASLGALIMVATLASPFALVDYAKTAAAFAVYASNLLFVRRQSDYFATNTVPDPLLHTWTLAVEEQFYLIFAPLVLFVAFATRGQTFLTFLKRATIAAVVISACALSANVFLGHRFPLLAFYTLPFRAWEFGIGALVASYVARDPAGETSAARARWMPLAGIAGMVITTLAVSERASSSGIALLLPTVSTALVIVGGRTSQPGIASKILTAAPLRLVGRLSYSWYLWHWPVLVGLEFINPEASLLWRLVACCLSFALAAACYRFVEQPLRTSSWLAIRPRSTLVAAAAAMLLVIGAAAGVGVATGGKLQSDEIQEIVRAQTEPFMPVGTHCHLSIAEITPGACVFGDTASATTIVLFGDSHAEQWFPAVDSAARQHRWRLISYTKSGCPSVDIEVSRSASLYYPECSKWRDAILERLETGRPSVVVVSNAHAYGVHLGGGKLESMLESRDARSMWQQGLTRLLARIQANGSKVLVIGDPPAPGFDVPICLSTPARSVASCGFTLSVANRDSSVGLEAPLVNAFPHARFLDTIDFFCMSGICPALQDDQIVWMDDNHVSARFSASLGDKLGLALRDLMGASDATSGGAARLR